MPTWYNTIRPIDTELTVAAAVDTVARFPIGNFVNLLLNILQTNSYCLSFLLAIALFPEVQKKAQAELDKVIGPGRLPELEDLDKLVYVRAVVMETLRWIPVLPLGIPHALDADDVYEGYHLPNGAIVIAVSNIP